MFTNDVDTSISYTLKERTLLVNQSSFRMSLLAGLPLPVPFELLWLLVALETLVALKCIKCSGCFLQVNKNTLLKSNIMMHTFFLHFPSLLNLLVVL